MGLRAKFNLLTLAGFAVGFLIAAVVMYRVFADNARATVLHNASIMMSAVNAVRNYTANDLMPLLPTQVDGKFVPQTVPAFAAQTISKLAEASLPDYMYREPALNPTNPSDRAQEWEADVIDKFRNDPKLAEVEFSRDTPVAQTLNLARPVSINDEACLTCHGTPSSAPSALINSYGAANGFGWKLHETVGAQIMTVPMAVALKLARDTYFTFMLILVGIFLVVLAILNLLLHYLVLVPVKKVSTAADAVSMGDENVEVYVKPGNDEISSLSVSFNRMRESLKRAMEMIK